jgi:signal transduction histidine kinase
MGKSEQPEPAAAAVDSPDWCRVAGRLAALGSIAGEAAHRFNNLRSVVEGTLDLIAADPAGPLTERRLERLREAAARANALAEGIVALARSHPGADVRLDIAGWLLAARPRLEQLLGERIALVLDVPPRPALLVADPDGLCAAVTALVLNARAAVGPAGRVCIRLERSRTEARSTLMLLVVDDGPGMPPEVVGRAREPFFTTRPMAAGLGLVVAEAFAEQQGGWLELSSGPGRGTVACLHLPAAIEAWLP